MNFSVLLSVYDPSDDVAAALASVQAQSLVEWDLVVVERGDILARGALGDFAKTTGRPVTHEKIAGSEPAAAVRNRLLELAGGSILAFLDANDSWMPRHLANAAQQFATGADVVVSDVRTSDPKPNKPANDLSFPAHFVTKPVRALFTREVIVTNSCVTLTRKTATNTGQFDTRFPTAEGRDYWLRCALAGAHFVTTNRATCRAIKRPTTGHRALLAAEAAVQFYEKHRDLAAVPAALRRRLLSASLVSLGRMLRPTDPAKAARCFWRAWSLQPVHVQTLGQFALTGWRHATPGPHGTEE